MLRWITLRKHLTAVLLGIALGSGCAAGASSPGAPVQGLSDALDAYRISPEDVLQISVWREADLDRSVIVRPDGGISFPLAGDVQAAGRTPAELEQLITERLIRFIPDAVVTVAVTELRGMRIYVTGKVSNPGQFEVGRYVDVLQALTLAGGLTPFAQAGSIKVLRRENGREVVYDFDYNQVKDGRNLGQNIRLKADDVVVVP
ncbi:MAG: polysaccharide biosynthesis/export family protein [Pseudomonadales bacterium]